MAELGNKSIQTTEDDRQTDLPRTSAPIRRRRRKSEGEPSPGRAERAFSLVPALLLVALPFLFGGVHPAVYLPLEAFIFLFVAAAVFVPAAVNSRSPGVPETPSTRWSVGAFLALAVWAACSGLVLRGFSEPHPVLGTASWMGDIRAFSSGVRDILFFAAALVTFRLSLIRSTVGERILTNALFAAAAFVSFTALAHWFSDNGKLFWIFEPDNRFVSGRARWPFVNSNHLGHFLAPLGFLVAERMSAGVPAIRSRIAGANRKNSMRAIVGDQSLHRRIFGLLISSTILVAVFTALAASLSRGAWLGFAAGSAVWCVLSLGVRTAPSALSTKARFATWGIGVLLLGSAVTFFLGSFGGELVERRLEYGLLSSKDEMRWKLYADSLTLLEEHPIAGVGLGNWAVRYPRVQDSRLAGINPEYLHSDPYQLVVETGVVGGVLLVLGIMPLLLGAYRRRAQPGVRTVAASLTALATASLLDFPFRIPAIAMLAAALCALLLSRIEDRALEPRS